MTLLWGRGWVIDYGGGASVGLAGGQAESVDALWATRGWRAAPTHMKKYPGVFGWWYHPCCSCRGDSDAFGVVLFLYSST